MTPFRPSNLLFPPHPLPPQIMCGDYGFRSGFGRMYQGGDGEKPRSGLALVR